MSMYYTIVNDENHYNRIITHLELTRKSFLHASWLCMKSVCDGRGTTPVIFYDENGYQGYDDHLYAIECGSIRKDVDSFVVPKELFEL